MVNKYLIAGCTGGLGSALMRQARAKRLDVIGLGHDDWDISNDEDVKRMSAGFGDRIVVNAAGIVRHRAIDALDTERMVMANTMGPRVLARHFERVVHISTDCVFDGQNARGYKETDGTCPSDTYGASKVGGELTNPHLTIRGSFLSFGAGGFLDRMILSQEQGATIIGFTDWRWNGLYVESFASIILELTKLAMSGTIHVFGPDTTKAEVVSLLARKLRPDLKVLDVEGGRKDMILRSDLFQPEHYEQFAGCPLDWEFTAQRMKDDYSNHSGGAARIE